MRKIVIFLIMLLSIVIIGCSGEQGGDGNKSFNASKVNYIDFPSSIDNVDKNKKGPIFTKELENIVNFKRKHKGNPIMVSTVREAKVYAESNLSKEAIGILAAGTSCEIGDYIKNEDGEFIFLRRIDKKNNESVPASGWVKKSEVEIDYSESRAFLFSGDSSTGQDDNLRLVYRAHGRKSSIPDGNNVGDVTIYLDMASLKEKENGKIEFKTVNVLTGTTKIERFILYTDENNIISGSFEETYDNVRKSMKKDGAVVKKKWVKDSYGIIYEAISGNPITPPGNLVETALYKVLQGE